MATPLESATPSTVDVDAAGVLALIDTLEADPRIEPHGLVLQRHGRRIAAGEWAPYTSDRIRLLYSLSKTFTGTALALAIGEGLLDLDDLVSDHLPDFFTAATDARTRALRVRHVASMATGHEREMLPDALAADPENPVRGFLTLPPTRDPGTVFAYNQPATETLAEILQRVTGGTLTEYLRPRLFDPLGIGRTAWQQDRPGHDLGYSGQHATTDAVARLGQLYLDDGVWNGRRLLPAGWAALAATPKVPSPLETNPDWACGYGFQLWAARHGYRGDGAFGQFMIVLPKQDAVLAITAATEEMQTVLDAVWTHLLPAFDRPASEAADTALADRLGTLRVPGAADPAASGVSSLVVHASAPANRELQLPALTLAIDGGTVHIGWGDATIRVPAAAEWQVAEAPVPVAVSVAAQPNAGARVDVLFLETPHRITLSTDEGALQARWWTKPLFQAEAIPLTALAAPAR